MEGDLCHGSERGIHRGLARKERDDKGVCERYGISRKTGSKWVQRFYDGGLPGLIDRSV